MTVVSNITDVWVASDLLPYVNFNKLFLIMEMRCVLFTWIKNFRLLFKRLCKTFYVIKVVFHIIINILQTFFFINKSEIKENTL